MYKEILQLVAVALTVAAFLINDFKRFSPSHTFKREQQRDFYIQHSVKVRSKINVISLVFKQTESISSLAAAGSEPTSGISSLSAVILCVMLVFVAQCVFDILQQSPISFTDVS